MINQLQTTAKKRVIKMAAKRCEGQKISLKITISPVIRCVYLPKKKRDMLMSLLDKHRCAFENVKILLYMGEKNGNMICRLVKAEFWLFEGCLRGVGLYTFGMEFFRQY